MNNLLSVKEMEVKVEKITAPEQLAEAFKIRKEVFVVEQNVAEDEEYDEFEETSTHFLALLDGKAAGTSRWRFTDKGIKLERFAVRQEARGKGIGKALVQAVLDDISRHPGAVGKTRYLHAQLTAVPLYKHFGFKEEGDIFDECGILHYKMKLS